jgi:hypothetical protein
MIGDVGMVHTCSIISRTQTSQNEYGEPVYTESITSSPCRFFHSNSGTNNKIIAQDSGKHTVSSPAVLLPADVTVTEGQAITSDIPGFSKAYEVTAVKPVFWMFSNTMHHYECDLKAVE